MIKKLLLLVFIYFLNLNLYSQTITGTISDYSKVPLKSANIIAKPLQENASLKFAIAYNKGRYRLELESNVKNVITASCISYKEQVLIIEPNSNITTQNSILESTKKL